MIPPVFSTICPVEDLFRECLRCLKQPMTDIDLIMFVHVQVFVVLTSAVLLELFDAFEKRNVLKNS